MKDAFRTAARTSGYLERRCHTRMAHSRRKLRSASQIAWDLAKHKVDVIMAPGTTQAVVAAKRASSTIPIVMVHISDPAGSA